MGEQVNNGNGVKRDRYSDRIFNIDRARIEMSAVEGPRGTLIVWLLIAILGTNLIQIALQFNELLILLRPLAQR
jgi:hypothetical protein